MNSQLKKIQINKMLYFMIACKGSKQIHVKKQIHRGSASSQGKRKTLTSYESLWTSGAGVT